MPLLINSQRTKEWEAAHIRRVSASLAAACLGLDRDISRKLAWRLILGKERQEENEFMRWGNQREDTARWIYQVETGHLVNETGFWVHDQYDWLGASPDGLIGEDGLLEVKCPQTLPMKVPIKHRIQMILQLAVTGRKWCSYFAWTPNHTFHRTVFASGAIGLIRRLDAFRLSYLVPELEPPRKKPKRRKK